MRTMERIMLNQQSDTYKEKKNVIRTKRNNNLVHSKIDWRANLD